MKISDIPTLTELALRKSSEVLLQVLNSESFSNFSSLPLSQDLASALLQRLPQFTNSSSAVAEFIMRYSPNPLALSQRCCNVDSVFSRLKSKSPFSDITSMQIHAAKISVESAQLLVENFQKLKSLEISECSFEPGAMEILLKGLRLMELESLKLSYLTLSLKDNAALNDYLLGNSSLHHLVLEHLGQEEGDSKLDQKDYHSSALLLSLIRCPYLLTLEYQNNGLGPLSISAMGKVIESCPLLNKVKFTYDLFSDPGSKDLIPILEKKETITLDLSENFMSNETKDQFLKTGKAVLNTFPPSFGVRKFR